jgi:hypothetical protein
MPVSDKCVNQDLGTQAAEKFYSRRLPGGPGWFRSKLPACHAMIELSHCPCAEERLLGNGVDLWRAKATSPYYP